MPIKFTLMSLKPRNPLVAACRKRLAGAHCGRKPRQLLKQSLRGELAQWRRASD